MMVSRLLPTMKMQVKFMDLQKMLLAGQTEQPVEPQLPHGDWNRGCTSNIATVGTSRTLRTTWVNFKNVWLLCSNQAICTDWFSGSEVSKKLDETLQAQCRSMSVMEVYIIGTLRMHDGSCRLLALVIFYYYYYYWILIIICCQLSG